MGGLSLGQMVGLVAWVGSMGGFIDGCRYGIVYTSSLRLGSRKFPTYELMLHLLGVATMYASVYIASLRMGGSMKD